MPAIKRRRLSRPIRDAIRDGIIRAEVALLDYGCGHGDDVRILQELGYTALGWDPTFAPAPLPTPAAVVNFGYVLNVIPDLDERAAALKAAFSLAEDVLIVSAYIHNGEATQLQSPTPYGDGFLTNRGTFQKLYYHKELGDYLTQVLNTVPKKADFGVYYVRKRPAPSVPPEPLDSLFGQNREGLFVEFAASYWRPIGKLLGREFSPWQRAILKTEFPSYKALCEEAEELLLKLESNSEVQAAYRQAPFGKRTRDALYVHRTSVRYLPILLQLVVATAWVAANEKLSHLEVIKVGSKCDTVSFLDTESFESVDYPALRSSLFVNRSTRTCKSRKESTSNPSIYHRKELFLHSEHDWRTKFVALTQSDEKANLLDRQDIGRRVGWTKIKADFQASQLDAPQ